MNEEDYRSLVVHPALWDDLALWLGARGLEVWGPVEVGPVDEDDENLSWFIRPKNLGEKS